MAGTEIARIPVAIVGGGPIGLVLALMLCMSKDFCSTMRGPGRTL
jgi:NADPH-dependent 2,4-dienoyl-CoA reductase/sulfur reductase-like enzyme